MTDKQKLSGSFIFGGYDVQQKLLEDEGIIIDERGIIDLSKYLWKPL